MHKLFHLERRGRIYIIAATLLVALNVADVMITRAALGAGATELNPVTRFFIEHAVLAYAVKFAVPAWVLVLALLPRTRERIDEVHIAAIWMVVGIYLMTVFVNVVTWLRLA